MAKWSRWHAPNFVVNNNGLEATNKVLKDDVTQRQLLPVTTFFTEIMKWLRSQSERRNPESVNYVPFAAAHTSTNTEFIEAWRWSKDKNKQTWITHDLVYVCVNRGVDGDPRRAKAYAMGDERPEFRVLPSTSNETLRKCVNLVECSTSTLFIASYPKSGTTWMQAIVFHLLSKGEIPLEHISLFSPFYEINETWNVVNDEIVSKYSENHKLLGWRVFNTHLLPSMLPQFTSARYIYVYRNGKDVAVSFYHHITNQVGNGGVENDDLRQFLADWSTGRLPFGSWICHLRNWLEAIEKSSNILLIRYEDMVTDLGNSILKIATFLDQNVPADRLNELAHLLSFQAMKAKKELYQPISVQWKDGFNFLRKGIIGDSCSHFAEEEEMMIDSMLLREFPDGIPQWFQNLNAL